MRGEHGLAVAVASAGLTSAATDALNLPTGTDLSFPDRLRTAAVQASARTAVDATIGGRDLDEALRANLLSAATSTIGAELAGKIGEAARSGDINTVAQLAAHAALGCGMGAATGGDDGCASGAGGAVVGEMFAMAYAETHGLTIEQIRDRRQTITQEMQADMERLRDLGVDLSRLSGALAAAIAGGDAAVGAMTAGNAAEHNAIPVIAVLVAAGVVLEATDKALTAWDAYQLGEAIANGDEERAAELSAELAIVAGIEALGVIPGSAILTKAALKLRKLGRADLADQADAAAQLKDAYGATLDTSFWKVGPEFRGSKVYQRDDLISPATMHDGMTNLERMKRGQAPIGPDGKKIELHHMLQTEKGPIAEVSKTFHTENRKTLHINPSTTPSGIDRGRFDQWRRNYWKERSKDFE